MSSNAHVPVLLGPVLRGLNIKPGGCYVDGTFGRGGHSGKILEQLNGDGQLLGIDRDPQAIASAPRALTSDPRFELMRGEIAELEALMASRGLLGKVDGLLLDLGVSSPQLDEAERGFSFQQDGPLDMRMDPQSGESARDWLAMVGEFELKRVLRQFGEEKAAARIARAIVAARASNPIESTGQLASIVASAAPKTGHKKHPATRTFQAIRIFVNRELEQLESALRQSAAVLRRGGRLCVISFHSLEDRMVKRFMRNASLVAEQYRGLPSIPDEYRPDFRVIGKLIMASAAEIAANPRARSARLRIAERT